eukprot:3328043-Rhodomonas_salina.1
MVVPEGRRVRGAGRGRRLCSYAYLRTDAGTKIGVSVYRRWYGHTTRMSMPVPDRRKELEKARFELEEAQLKISSLEEREREREREGEEMTGLLERVKEKQGEMKYLNQK